MLEKGPTKTRIQTRTHTHSHSTISNFGLENSNSLKSNKSIKSDKNLQISDSKCFKGIPRDLFRSRKKNKFKLFLINPTFYLVEAGFQVGFLKKEPLLLNKKWDF